MWSLIRLNEGCIRHVGDYLSTLDAYRMVVALKASRDEVSELISKFSCLSKIVVTTGESASDLGNGQGWSDSSLQQELRDALIWAIHDEDVERDIRSVQLYGMLDGVDFWEIVRYRNQTGSTGDSPSRKDEDTNLQSLANLETLHCDNMTYGDIDFWCQQKMKEIEKKSDSKKVLLFENLRSLYIIMEGGARLDSVVVDEESLPFGRANSRASRYPKETSSSKVEFASEERITTVSDKFMRLIREYCPMMEDIGDMNGWTADMVHAFFCSTYSDGTVENLAWPSLKTLNLGVLRQQADTWLHMDIWEEAQRHLDDQGLGPFLVDRGADEYTEAIFFSIISFLRADTFPSLEKLVVVSHDDTEDLSQFLFAWVTYDFHVKLAELYERSSPTEKEEIARKTPRVRLYVDFFQGRRDKTVYRGRPVAASIKKLQLVCPQLSVDDFTFNEDYLEGNQLTDSFVYRERWRELMAWLRVKERHHPQLFPLAIFPNLEEIESNCGLPYKELASFLKGEQHAYLPNLRLYAGSVADSTAGLLLKHSSFINTSHFEVLPDMAAPMGFAAHALHSLDWGNPTKRALYRLMRAYLQGGLQQIQRAESPVALLSGPLMELYACFNPFPEVLPWRYDAPAHEGPFRAHQPLLLSEIIAADCLEGDDAPNPSLVPGPKELEVAQDADSDLRDIQGPLERDFRRRGDGEGEEALNTGPIPACIKLFIPKTLNDLLDIYKSESSSRKTFDGAWITAVKSGAFSTCTHTLAVPDWLLGNLCCSLGVAKLRGGVISPVAFFPFDRRVHRSQSLPDPSSGTGPVKGEGEGEGDNRVVVVENWDTGRPLHVRGAGSEESTKASTLRRVAQLFCHTPCLRHLTIRTGPWSMDVNDRGEREGHEEEESEQGEDIEGQDEDEAADAGANTRVFAALRGIALNDAHWSIAKRAYVLLSFKALVEAMCELRFRATLDTDYLARDPDVPYLPDRVRYGEVDSEEALDALPVALGELECLELCVQGGHTTIYTELRAAVLGMSFDGVSGTTLPHKASPVQDAGAGAGGRKRAQYRVADAFTGAYVAPERGDDVHQRMLRVVLSHGDREKTLIYFWKNKTDGGGHDQE